MKEFSFPKSEKLVSRWLIDRLFSGGASKSMSAFPLRLVYMLIDEEETTKAAVDNRAFQSVQVMISVPKRCFKHAVKRNHVKRQVREAYRLHRDLFQVPQGKRLIMSFIWLDSQLHSTADVEQKVCNLLRRIKTARQPS